MEDVDTTPELRTFERYMRMSEDELINERGELVGRPQSTSKLGDLILMTRVLNYKTFERERGLSSYEMEKYLKMSDEYLHIELKVLADKTPLLRNDIRKEFITKVLERRAKHRLGYMEAGEFEDYGEAQNNENIEMSEMSRIDNTSVINCMKYLVISQEAMRDIKHLERWLISLNSYGRKIEK